MSSMKCTGIKHSLWKLSGSAEAGTETRYEEYRIHKKGQGLLGSTFIYVLHWKNSFHLLCIWWGRKEKQKEKEWLETFSRLYLPPVLESNTITEHQLSFPPPQRMSHYFLFGWVAGHIHSGHTFDSWLKTRWWIRKIPFCLKFLWLLENSLGKYMTLVNLSW